MGPFGFLLQGHGELADVSVRLDPDRRTDAVPCCSHLALGHRDWCLHDHDLGNVYVSSRASPIELNTVLLMGLVPLEDLCLCVKTEAKRWELQSFYGLPFVAPSRPVSEDQVHTTVEKLSQVSSRSASPQSASSANGHSRHRNT